MEIMFNTRVRYHIDCCVTMDNEKALDLDQTWLPGFSALRHYTKFGMASPRTVTRKSKEAEILTRDEPRMGMGMNCFAIVCWLSFILPLLFMAVLFFISAFQIWNVSSARLQSLILGAACVVGVIVIFMIMKAVRNSSKRSFNQRHAEWWQSLTQRNYCPDCNTIF